MRYLTETTIGWQTWAWAAPLALAAFAAFGWRLGARLDRRAYERRLAVRDLRADEDAAYAAGRADAADVARRLAGEAPAVRADVWSAS